METYYIGGYRIAARSYAQALESARQLTKGEYPFDWPGEQDYKPAALQPILSSGEVSP